MTGTVLRSEVDCAGTWFSVVSSALRSQRDFLLYFTLHVYITERARQIGSSDRYTKNRAISLQGPRRKLCPSALCSVPNRVIVKYSRVSYVAASRETNPNHARKVSRGKDFERMLVAVFPLRSKSKPKASPSTCPYSHLPPARHEHCCHCGETPWRWNS